MQVIHFTEGAADRLDGFKALRARLVDLADAEGACQISCLHVASGGHVLEPPETHACLLLLAHGCMTVTATATGMRLPLSAGVGVIVEAGERYSLESETGAIVIAVEAAHLTATAAGISTPARIAGQRWPGDDALAGSSGGEAHAADRSSRRS